MTVDSNHEGCPNYYPNSFSGPKDDIRKYSESKYTLNHADVGRFNSADEDNFTQVYFTPYFSNFIPLI